MDPNANLQAQERLLTPNSGVAGDTPEARGYNAVRLYELRVALKHWLASGGFEPDWTAAPRAARWYRKRG